MAKQFGLMPAGSANYAYGCESIGTRTLINSLVGRDRVIVPSGGVGPLTAQALRIEYGNEPSLQAFYHPPRTLWNLIFALEMILRVNWVVKLTNKNRT